jgi:Ala-tRNA(Pro) deacylase
MGVPGTITNFLRANGIEFRLVEHPRSRHSAETAHAAHVRGARLAKAVVLEDGERYVLAVVPSTHRVDVEAFERIFHRPFSLVREEDFAMLFRDCRPGAVPPIGEAYGITTVVDDALTEPPEVFLEAGDHEHLIQLDHDAFLDLIEDAERGRVSYQA